MIEFLLLLVGFCYVLHKMCAEKGISPWSYLIGFVTGFFLILFLTSAAIVFFYGPNILNDPEAGKEIMSFTLPAILFQFMLFLFFRRKISRISDYHDEDDETHTPPSDGTKKDLSYFR
ncbi:MAG: hypothetical protein JWO06_3701 [Bacteroidota bacterium]|nr:hypothetical protein [Bacteroidota bacterium]